MNRRLDGTDCNLLSIVIIARNEARRIGKCIESALAAASRFPETEVMLVDSASTDGTPEIAGKFAITIVQLKPEWPLTPGAGRYLGTLASHSEYILFVDGDTWIYPEFLPDALDFLEKHPTVAGVGGTREEFYVDEQGELTGEIHRRYRVREATEVPGLGGDALYRHSALNEAGTFNPYLAWNEEAELALRLRKAGYTLWRLPIAMTKHYSFPRGTYRETIRRFHVGFYPRAGRTLRATYNNGLAGRFIREFLMNYVVTGTYLFAGLLSAFSAIFDRRWLKAWLACSGAIFVTYAIRKSSARSAFANLLARVMIVYGLVTGFFQGRQDPDQYPRDAIILQRQGNGAGTHAAVAAGTAAIEGKEAS
ncbi:MAG: glycosyltransferase [Chloroflexi bacterium]|nr:glycosyltransferase [Chloroflexota bacterium]